MPPAQALGTAPDKGTVGQAGTSPEPQGGPGREGTAPFRGHHTIFLTPGSKMDQQAQIHCKRKCEPSKFQHIVGKNNCARPAANYLPMLGYSPDSWVTSCLFQYFHHKHNSGERPSFHENDTSAFEDLPALLFFRDPKGLERDEFHKSQKGVRGSRPSKEAPACLLRVLKGSVSRGKATPG